MMVWRCKPRTLIQFNDKAELEISANGNRLEPPLEILEILANSIDLIDGLVGEEGGRCEKCPYLTLRITFIVIKLHARVEGE